MKLTFKQNHSESGSVTGKGIDWYWSGRSASGDMDAVEEIAESVEAAVQEEWGDHLTEDACCELPIEAEVEWDGESVDNVTEVRLNFEFDATALDGPEETLAEVQEFFSTLVMLREGLRSGPNTATVGDKKLTIFVNQQNIA